MELINNLDKTDYDNFVKHHQKSHFLQSYPWGEFEKEYDNWLPHYLGIKDNDTLVGATLLLEKKLLFGYKFFYAPRGYIIDFNNNTLLEETSRLLKNYAKNNKAIFIKINPDIKLENLDIEGNILPGVNNFPLIDKLKKLGYKHLGFYKNFDRSEPRYTFRLDLTKGLEYITNNFHPTTKKIIKRGNPYQLELTKNNSEDIESFYITMLETSKREGVLYHDIEYYRHFYQELHKENMSDLYVVKANIPKIKEIELAKIIELTAEKDKLVTKNDLKNQNKKQELINQIQKIEKELKLLSEIKEDKLVLSSILTAKYGNKVWTVHGGNHSLLRELNANYYIYYEIIKDAITEGYQLIDFFGTTGDPNINNPVYGIHLFKKRLGGEYTEFIGEFDFIINKPLYFIFITLIPIYRKIKRTFIKK
ncbi:MAG: peptidoglycan bridge formation glycyltransferase FemA/FemB family protein [Bacilli bacterium]